MKIGTREKFTLTLIISVVLVGALFWFYAYMTSSVRQAGSNLAEIEAEITSLEEERKQARIVERILEKRGEDIARVNAFLVSRERPIQFIEELEGLAKATGNLMALAVDSPAGGGGDLLFRITLDGTEAGVSKYLKLFELLPYDIRIEDFSFQKITEGDKPAGTDTRLTLQIGVKAR